MHTLYDTKPNLLTCRVQFFVQLHRGRRDREMRQLLMPGGHLCQGKQREYDCLRVRRHWKVRQLQLPTRHMRQQQGLKAVQSWIL
jgi:hypothetical protein